MGWPRSVVNGVQPNAAITDYFVLAGNGTMKNGLYTQSNWDMPEVGFARQVTITHASAGATDTLGVVTVTGTNMAGQTISEVITPVADSLVTGTKWFRTINADGIRGSGWTTAAGADGIIVGCAGDAIIAEGTGTLHGIQINTTAAGTITVSDAAGTIAVLPVSVAVGTFYLWDVQWSGYLRVVMAGASNITVLHSGSAVTDYALS